MARVSKIKYNPALSIEENAAINGCSVDGVRYYIKSRGIDRRHEAKMNILKDIKGYLKDHPDASKMEVAKATKHGINTIREYWNVASGKGELKPTQRVYKRETKAKQSKERLKDLLDAYPIEYISEYLKERKAEAKRQEKKARKQPTRKEVDKTKYELVTILDGMPFRPYEEFSIPVKECVQFHSEALPENEIMSNHFDCIIRFRDYEFISVEQLFAGLTFTDAHVDILKDIMNCKSGRTVKSHCNKKFPHCRDADHDEKQYRIIALCHLYKYLSVREYRDRLRETYPQILVECPNGSDGHFGLVQNLDTNIFEGNNCSGRTTMIVRDMMMKLENDAIQEMELKFGRQLDAAEKEGVIEEVCEKVRAKFDSNETVLNDSRKLLEFFEANNVSKVRKCKLKPYNPPVIDEKSRCLVLDFDFTIFDTSVDDPYRKVDKNRDLDKAFELIPEYKLYEGWREVFEWCMEKKTKIGILSDASRKLIEAAMSHFNLPYDAIVGAQYLKKKPNAILANMLLGKLNVREGQVVYVGDSLVDEIQARCSKFAFYGCTWHNPKEEPFTAKGIQTISDPREIIKILENIPIV